MKCPKVRRGMRLLDKHTFTGEEIREYHCGTCDKNRDRPGRDRAVAGALGRQDEARSVRAGLAHRGSQIAWPWAADPIAAGEQARRREIAAALPI